jgi:hypothetical protein
MCGLFALHQSGGPNVHPLLWALRVLLEFAGKTKGARTMRRAA